MGPLRNRRPTTKTADDHRARVRDWHHQRRARELCCQAPCTNRPEINPRTGERFWACRACRLTRSAKQRLPRGTPDTVGPIGPVGVSDR